MEITPYGIILGGVRRTAVGLNNDMNTTIEEFLLQICEK